jgi:leucyl aminopeptidase (aminopeptidase T)
VVECFGNSYKILSAPKSTLQKFNRRKKEAWDLLMQVKKKNSLPAEIIKMKEDNFGNIGEFAVNTNPKAKLCDYLIVNEKIAKMMHIALGAGYEDDRATDYHIDVVFDAPRQKLDVFGKDGKGKEHWILRNGEFVG